MKALNTGGIYKFSNFQPISVYTMETLQGSDVVTDGIVMENRLRSIEP